MLTTDPLFRSDPGHPQRFYFGSNGPGPPLGLSSGLSAGPDGEPVMDLHVTSLHGNVQVALHGVFAVRGYRNALEAGPLRLEVEGSTVAVTLVQTSGIGLRARFTPSGPPLDEPRYRYPEQLPILDYRRVTQFGTWEGHLHVDGRTIPLDGAAGVRDRSVGRRPALGSAELDTFWWLWMPCWFAGGGVLLATNDLPDGRPWNRFALWDGSAYGRRTGELTDYDLDFVPGTRHVRTALLHAADPAGRPVRIRLAAQRRLLMYGMGYGNASWPHATDTGPRPGTRQDLDLSRVRARLPRYFHSQAWCRAELETADGTEDGAALLETLLVGARPSAGLHETFDVPR